jgi:hypothetical protein
MTHSTAAIAAYSIELTLTERTPVKDLTMGFFESTVEHRLPCLGIDQLHAPRKIVAVATLKLGR